MENGIKSIMENDSNPVNENYIVSSLVRGLEILNTFTVKKPALKVSEIADITHFDKATIFRFVYTLEKLGYLVRDKETKRYHQSVRLLSLCLPARVGIKVRDAALPLMAEVSRHLNEAAKLAILDGVDITIVGLGADPDKLAWSTPLGYRAPAFCTALGKVLLAYQPLESLDRLISRINFVKYTDNTIMDPDTLREELISIRNRGYATQDGEMLLGHSSVAAPIFDLFNTVTAAVDISFLSSQIENEDMRAFFVDEVTKLASSISNQLGKVTESD